MRIRHEVRPFVVIVLAGYALLASLLHEWMVTGLLACLFAGYFLYFFRDPERFPPSERNAVVAGADGIVTSVITLREETCLNASCVRISIFLSLFDVHVNRAPISGKASFLGYFPGKHLFTFQEKSSEVNQHNRIMIVGERTKCLVYQIVGPVCRRVVYWLSHDEEETVVMGERIGMMKFGSRLDMYLPAEDVDVLVKPGTVVRAGETVVAHFKQSAETDGIPPGYKPQTTKGTDR